MPDTTSSSTSSTTSSGREDGGFFELSVRLMCAGRQGGQICWFEAKRKFSVSTRREFEKVNTVNRKIGNTVVMW